MFIILCKFLGRNRHDPHPRIMLGGDKNLFNELSVEMIPVNKIVLDLKFELGSKSKSDDRKQDMDLMRSAFLNHGRRFGFEPTVVELPEQHSLNS
jgi:hypothetical protein